MKKKILCIALITIFSLVQIASANQNTMTIDAYYQQGWMFDDLKEGSRITWEIECDDPINIYILTKYDWDTRDMPERRIYYREMNMLSSFHEYTVPHSDSWALIIENPYSFSVQVTYNNVNSFAPPPPTPVTITVTQIEQQTITTTKTITTEKPMQEFGAPVLGICVLLVVLLTLSRRRKTE